MARILVVDDDPDVLEACRLVLGRERHEVATASSRSEGMASIASRSPDLVILDVMMEQPDDGIAMAQELRRRGFAAPILMLTSIGQVTGMRFGRDEQVLPVDDFHEKPIAPSALVAKVEGLLAGCGR